MGHLGNQTSGEMKLREVLALAATIMACVAAVLSVKEKAFIVATGVIGALILLGIAFYAVRRSDRTVAGMYAIVAVIILVVTATYGVFGGATEIDEQPSDQRQSSETLPRMPLASPDTFEAPAKEQSVFEGSARMEAGQSIDLDASNSKAKMATSLSAPADVFIDQLAFGYDRDGYLVAFKGNPSEGKRGCVETLEAGGARGAMFALPEWRYCAVTSEGRIAMIRFSSDSGVYMGRVGSISYQVWN